MESEDDMNMGSVKKGTLVASLAACSVAGVIVLSNTKKAKAKRIARKAGKKIELMGSLLQSVADIAMK